jgi:hypothetical protein
VEEVLIKKGFAEKLRKWVMSTVRGEECAATKMGKMVPISRPTGGLRQGDPLSPLLFNLAADALAYILDNAKELGLIRGVVPHLIQGGLTHLQYVDDTVCVKEMTGQYKI